MQKNKRKPYLLIEIVIALSLVMLCVFPLLKLHQGLLNKEKEMISSSQQLLQNELNYITIKQQLYQGKYSLNDFPDAQGPENNTYLITINDKYNLLVEAPQ